MGAGREEVLRPPLSNAELIACDDLSLLSRDELVRLVGLLRWRRLGEMLQSAHDRASALVPALDQKEPH